MKNNKRYILVLSSAFSFLAALPWLIAAQDTSQLTLNYCQQKARENFPLLKQEDLLKKSSDLTIENISKSYLPSIEFNGQASYQSTVVQIPFELPGLEIPSFPKDHYQLSLDITQTIYDGGVSHQQREIEQSGSETEKAKVEVEMFRLRQQVNLVYFAILLGGKTIEQLNIIKENLLKKFEQVNVSVRNGAVLQSNADQIEAEIIKTDQRITEAKSIRTGYVQSLSLLIHQALNDSVKPQMPAVDSAIPEYSIQSRPDFRLLQLQQVNFEAMKGLTKTATTPKLGAFLQLGYGRPGPDPFSTTFDPFYIAGVKMNWNVWNWNRSKNQRQIYAIQQEMTDRQMETLDQNIRVQALQQEAEIDKLQHFIGQDQDLIAIQKKISKTFSNQLDNGVITVTDYLTQVNSELLAALSLTTHQLQIVYARVNYLAILGR